MSCLVVHKKLSGETSQNTRCPIQCQMEVLINYLSLGPQEEYFKKAIRLLLMCSLYAVIRAILSKKGFSVLDS